MKNLAFITFLTIGFFSMSQTKTTTSDGDWADPNIWSPTGVPVLGDSIFISNTVTLPDIFDTIYPSYLEVESSGELQGSSDSVVLSIYGQNLGDIVNNGTIDVWALDIDSISIFRNNQTVKVELLNCEGEVPGQLINDGTINSYVLSTHDLTNNGQLTISNLNTIGVFVNNAQLVSDESIQCDNQFNTEYSLENYGTITANVLVVSGSSEEDVPCFYNMHNIYVDTFILTSSGSNDGVIEVSSYARIQNANVGCLFKNFGNFSSNICFIADAEFEVDGYANVSDSLFLFESVMSGEGNFCVQDYSFLFQSSIEGSLDFCDQTGGQPDEMIASAIAPTVTICGANSCTPVQNIGLEEINVDDLWSVYPNPTDGVLNFQLKEGISVEGVEVYSYAGRLVFEEDSMSSNKMDLNFLESGSYLLVLKTNKGKSTKLFIKN